jgi:hypothetical protein
MCKSSAEGGKRCAGHTEAPYRQAFAQFESGQSYSVADLDKLKKVAIAYAGTKQGQRAIAADAMGYEDAEYPEQIAVLVTLQVALHQGQIEQPEIAAEIATERDKARARQASFAQAMSEVDDTGDISPLIEVVILDGAQDGIDKLESANEIEAEYQAAINIFTWWGPGVTADEYNDRVIKALEVYHAKMAALEGKKDA